MAVKSENRENKIIKLGAFGKKEDYEILSLEVDLFYERPIKRKVCNVHVFHLSLFFSSVL